MGRKDFGSRETKKPKKDLKKLASSTPIMPSEPPPEVEVIGRKKRKIEKEE